MKLKQAYELLEQMFDAIPAPTLEDIRQEGVYINFLGIKNKKPLKDVASFAVVLSANSLNKDSAGAIDKISIMRKAILDYELSKGVKYFKELKSATFPNNTLYLYAFIFEIEVKEI